MKKEFNSFDENREKVIKKSRDVLKLSKQIIYAVHRGAMDEALSFIKKIKSEKTHLTKLIKKDIGLNSIGAYKVAIGEYAEALLYYLYLKTKKIATRSQLDINTTHYLLGLIDLTGELGRKAVQYAGNGRFAEVVEIKDAVSSIYGELLNFDFRESDLRRKFDSVKYDLKKLEDLVLDLKLKGKL